MVTKKDDDFDTEIGGDTKDADAGRRDGADQGGAGTDDQDDADDDAEPTLEELKDELARTKRALAKANREATKTRLAAKKGTAGRAPRQDADADDAAARAEGEVEKYRLAALRTGAQAALLAAGLKAGSDPKAAARRAAKLLDLDDVEITDGGDLDGLDEAIEDLKADMPELFRSDDDDRTTGRRRPAAGRIDAGTARRDRATQEKGGGKSNAERLGSLLRGRG